MPETEVTSDDTDEMPVDIEMYEIPVFMLKAKDWVWHPLRQWFYLVYMDSAAPNGIASDNRMDSDLDDFVWITREGIKAQEWNETRRGEWLSR